MKSHISPAIIMRIREFGETDLLVTFFTPDKGRLKGVAKGARKSRRRFVNCLDIFSLVNLEYESRGERALCFLHSGKLINAHAGLRSDFEMLSKASYMIELTEMLFPWGVSDRHMFEWLRDSLDALAKGGRVNIIPVLFELRAMALGGYRINTERCCTCGRTYRAKGTAVYKPEQGGIACLKCHQVSALSPPIGPAAVNVLKLMHSKPFTTLKEVKLGDEILRELKPVLKLHRDFRLEQRLKTSKYVE